MRTIIISTALAVIMAGPAWATDPHTPAPTPTPQASSNNARADAAALAAAFAAAKASAAATAAGGSSAGGAGGAATAAGGAATASPTQNVNVGNNGGWNGAGFPVSSATAPSYAIGQCQWAISGGAQFFGFGGSAGGAGLYEFCKAMMQADHFRKLGRDDVAKMLECNNENFRAAYMMAGTPCRQDVPKAQLAVTPIVQPVGWVPPSSSAPSTIVAGGAVVPLSRQAQCFDSAGRPVPLGTAGAVRCN